MISRTTLTSSRPFRRIAWVVFAIGLIALQGDLGLAFQFPTGFPPGVGFPQLSGGFPGGSQQIPEPDTSGNPPEFVAERVLVKFRPEVGSEGRGRVIAEAGATIEGEIPGAGVLILSLGNGVAADAVAEAMSRRPEVEFAEPDHWVPLSRDPNDPSYPAQWHLPKIQAPAAWDTTIGDSGLIIAVLDTGVDSTHPDLASKMIPGWNVYDGNTDTADVYGHGTAVAGSIAAAGDNWEGIASVVWNCLVMPIRISATNGWATYSAAASGLTWAADGGARVANISYSMSNSSTVRSAAQYFQNQNGGGVVTISAGNSSTFDSSADNPYVLTVGATDRYDVLAGWSNTGNNVDVTAPGVSIYTTANGGGYRYASGTSFSAPITAGVAALAFSANPNLSGAEVQEIVRESADDMGDLGWDPTYGAGRVNAAEAVALAMAAGGGGPGDPPDPGDTVPPVVSFNSPQGSSPISGMVMVDVSAVDSTGVASVSLAVDGTVIGTDTASPYTFELDTTTLTNGSHTLTATAADISENTGSGSMGIEVSNSVADTEPPNVSFNALQGIGPISGTVMVDVAAVDNVGVASVSLAVDGIVVGMDASAPYIFELDTTELEDRSYTLTATATDTSGNTGSAFEDVTVSNAADTEAPVPSITSNTVRGRVRIEASATDNIGVVTIEVYVDGSLLASASSDTISVNWNTKPKRIASGAHQIQVKALDAAGNVGEIAITVYK